MDKKEWIKTIALYAACTAAGVTGLMLLPGWTMGLLAGGLMAYVIYTVVVDLREAARLLEEQGDDDEEEMSDKRKK